MLVDLIDQKLNNVFVEIEVERVINVALLCVQIKAKRRPSMSQALAMLQGEVNFPNVSHYQNEIDVSPHQNEIDVSSHMEVSTNEVGFQS
jgi:GH25 family lysozyme M1 (1,4-beta-N-acetylmuramidase)